MSGAAALDCGDLSPLSEASRASRSGEASPQSKAAAPQNPERARPCTKQSFCLPNADFAAQGNDPLLNRYKEVIHAQVAHRPPGEILGSLAELEKEIVLGMQESEAMLAKSSSAK